MDLSFGMDRWMDGWDDGGEGEGNPLCMVRYVCIYVCGCLLWSLYVKLNGCAADSSCSDWAARTAAGWQMRYWLSSEHVCMYVCMYVCLGEEFYCSDCVVQGERRGSWVAVCGPTAAALLYSKKKDAQCVYMCICVYVTTVVVYSSWSI